MSTTKIPDLAQIPDIDCVGAINALATALVQTWKACEREAQKRGGPAGDNLAEALSYALGLAAVGLGLDRDAQDNRIEGDEGQRLAVEGLVRHRPGCWEADHIRNLTYMVDLIVEDD